MLCGCLLCCLIDLLFNAGRLTNNPNELPSFSIAANAIVISDNTQSLLSC